MSTKAKWMKITCQGAFIVSASQQPVSLPKDAGAVTGVKTNVVVIDPQNGNHQEAVSTRKNGDDLYCRAADLKLAA